MRHTSIVVGNYYRHKDSPQFWAKAIEILPPKKGHNTAYLVKCEWTTSKWDSFGLIKHFKPSDLMEIE